MNDLIEQVENNKYKLTSPTNEKGNVYWIPVVVKNWDYLCGYIHSFRQLRILKAVVPFPLEDLMISGLGSDRFNDTMPSGNRVRDLKKDDLIEKLKEASKRHLKNTHIDNIQYDIHDEAILTVTCSNCSMSYMYKTVNNIPKSSTLCSSCGSHLFVYTNLNDFEFVYDGDRKRLNDAMVDSYEAQFTWDDEESIDDDEIED